MLKRQIIPLKICKNLQKSVTYVTISFSRRLNIKTGSRKLTKQIPGKNKERDIEQT